MLAASDAYLAALSHSHQAHVRVRAYRREYINSKWVRTRHPGTLSVADGSFVVSGQQNVRHTATLSVANEVVDGDGHTWADLLNAYDTDLRIDFGIQVDYDLDGITPVVEYVQVGLLRVDKAMLDGVTLSIEASDDGSRVAEYEIVQPWPTTTDDTLGFSCINAIKYFINKCYPLDDQPTINEGGVFDDQFQYTSIFQGDRWEAINALADQIGAVVYVDEAGDWWINPAPVDLGTPVWEFDIDQDGTIVGTEAGTDRTETYNRVILRYELPFAGSFTATATDTAPTSPTRWDGPMGRKPIIVDNDTVYKSTAAQKAADTLLAQYKGRAQRINLDAVYNPLLVPGDTIAVRLPNGQKETQWVDSVEISIPPGQMLLTTRVVEVVL